MRLPRLRFGGPIEGRNAVPLLGLVAMLIVARIPLGFIALLLVSILVVVVQGIRRTAPWPRSLRVLLTWCLGASFVSVALFHTSQLPSTGNDFTVMVAICAVAVATFAGGRLVQASNALVSGLYAGLLLSWLISLGEAATGVKMMDILYPGTNTAALVSGNRFFVSAFFPNYNDYSCAMVMLSTIIIAKLVFQPRVGVVRTLGRLFVLLTAAFFIVYMGSRGALIGLLLAGAIVLLTSVRAIDRAALSVRFGLVGFLVAVAVGATVWSSSYVQDHSTSTRGTIITNALQLLGADPVSAVLGFGSLVSYQAAAQARFGNILMDPHNLLLEMVIGYGFPALLLYVVCWWVLVHRGLVQLRVPMNWRSVAAVTVSVLMPVLGVVPSSTLRYHVFWLWLIAACGYLVIGRLRLRDAALAAERGPADAGIASGATAASQVPGADRTRATTSV